MEISLSMTDGIPVFRLSGRLDVLTAPLLEDRIRPLTEGETPMAVLECSGLSYVSSAGIRVFLTSLRLLKGKGGGIVFSTLSPTVRDLFQLAGLADVFPVEETVEKAAARLRQD